MADDSSCCSLVPLALSLHTRIHSYPLAHPHIHPVQCKHRNGNSPHRPPCPCPPLPPAVGKPYT